MEIDIEQFDALRAYLAAHGHVGSSEKICLQNLAGGVSNRTVMVKWPDGRSWVIKQALNKLRVNVDWFSSPDRIAVEAKALRWLNHAAPPGTTPAFIFEDIENHLLGMAAIPEEHANWKSLLLSGTIVPDHFEQFGFLLGTIHRRSTELRSEVSQAFADTTYFENLRLEPYYLYTAQMTPDAAEFLNALANETLHHHDSLVHGDFSPKNTLIYRGRLILLDYEVVHFGDPAFDLGFALTHFLSKAHHLPQVRGRLATSAELFWHVYYREIALLSWAEPLESRAIRHTLGCLLARVAGKSPLEYLTQIERKRQLDVVLAILRKPPNSVPHLISEFVHKIETYGNH
jgi:5-methylthioribose kinase